MVGRVLRRWCIYVMYKHYASIKAWKSNFHNVVSDSLIRCLNLYLAPSYPQQVAPPPQNNPQPGCSTCHSGPRTFRARAFFIPYAQEYIISTQIFV